MEKRNVLITGVSSTVGRQLAQALYFDKKVDKVIGVARGEMPYYFDDLDKNKFIYKNVNILKSRELTNLFLADYFKASNIDTVVHLAFYNRIEDYGKDSHQLNVEGTKNLIDRCLENPHIKKFIFKCSHIVYQVKPDNPVLLDESSDLNFNKEAVPCVRDRVDADMLCRAKMDAPNLNIVVIRTSPIIGRNIHGAMNSYFDSPICFKAMGYDPMINLIHVRDVVEAIQLSIHKTIRGVFNLAGKETAPISEFIRMNRSRAVTLPTPFLPFVNKWARRLGLSDYYYSVEADIIKHGVLLDDSKARKILGYEPKHHVKFD